MLYHFSLTRVTFLHGVEVEDHLDGLISKLGIHVGYPHLLTLVLLELFSVIFLDVNIVPHLRFLLSLNS